MSPQMGEYTKQDDNAVMAAHTAVLDAHTRDFYQQMVVGRYYLSGSKITTTLVVTANRLYTIPFLIARTATWDRLGLQITVPGAGGTKARLGIYNFGADGLPTTLVVDGGQVAVDAAAIVAATISQQLTKGWYYAAFVSDGTPTVKSGMASSGIPLGIFPTSFAYNYLGYYAAFAYAALPADFPAAPTIVRSLSTHPCVPLRLESMD